jgi:hypothetical protein
MKFGLSISRLTLRKFARLALFVVLALFILATSIMPALADGPGGTVYLPLLTGGGGGGNPPPPTEPPPTQPGFTVKKFFVEPETKTASGAVAIDAQGGKHLAYDYYLPYNEHPAAVYLYCAPGLDCSNGANWSGVSMLDQVEEVQLALTPEGKPRLLIKTGSTHSGDNTGFDFYFAACDGNCTDVNSWAGTFILYNWGTSTTDISNHETPQRYFALDHLGRPRFVYYDRNYRIEPDHFGTFYAWCDAACETSPDAWNQALICGATPYDAEIFEWPSLTFTNTGQPRLVASIFAFDPDPDGVYYVACDANCENSDNWDRTWLFERGSMHYVAWDIAMDGAGRAHVAFYKGDTLDNTEFRLYYGICETNCLIEYNWNRFDMGFPDKAGEDVDLVMDAQGRPRLAYLHNGDELEFAWCNSACGLTASWQRRVIDTTAAITLEWTPARPPTCDAAFWNTLIPVMALDPQGNAFVAYEAKYDTRCWLTDPADPTKEVYTFHQLWHTVRGVMFPQP